MSTYQSAAKLFNVLRHPARLAILNVLRHGEQCVCHIEAALDFRQAYISQQLMVLRQAGLVQDRRDGLNMYYRVVDPRVFAVFDAAQLGPQPAPHTGPTQSIQPKACPCPHCNPKTNVSSPSPYFPNSQKSPNV